MPLIRFEKTAKVNVYVSMGIGSAVRFDRQLEVGSIQVIQQAQTCVVAGGSIVAVESLVHPGHWFDIDSHPDLRQHFPGAPPKPSVNNLILPEEKPTPTPPRGRDRLVIED